MKKILLTQGKYAKVDNSDFDLLDGWSWCVLSGNNNKLYAKRAVPNGAGKQKFITMHSSIMKTPKGMEIDHIDGDGLNNQKSNLRICTHSENIKNRTKSKNNKSGFKGVCWNKEKKKWKVYISSNKKLFHLGYFLDKEEAYKAYCDACLKYHGEFSKF